MPTRVNAPDGPIDFPDSMDDGAILAVMREKYPPQAQEVTPDDTPASRPDLFGAPMDRTPKSLFAGRPDGYEPQTSAPEGFPYVSLASGPGEVKQRLDATLDSYLSPVRQGIGAVTEDLMRHTPLGAGPLTRVPVQGLSDVAQSFATPENAEIAGALATGGAALPAYAPAIGQGAAAYFAGQGGRQLSETAPQAIQTFLAGDPQEQEAAARTLLGGGLATLLPASHAVMGYADALRPERVEPSPLLEQPVEAPAPVPEPQPAPPPPSRFVRPAPPEPDPLIAQEIAAIRARIAEREAQPKPQAPPPPVVRDAEPIDQQFSRFRREAVTAPKLLSDTQLQDEIGRRYPQGEAPQGPERPVVPPPPAEVAEAAPLVREDIPPAPAPSTEPSEEARFPRASAQVSGLRVRKDVPNMDSIGASMSDYEVLPGVREVNLSEFYDGGKPPQTPRTKELARQIRESGEINPLIVVLDEKGPYVLEGGHRLDALFDLGVEKLPAVVVRDLDNAPKEPPAPEPPPNNVVTPSRFARVAEAPVEAAPEAPAPQAEEPVAPPQREQSAAPEAKPSGRPLPSRDALPEGPLDSRSLSRYADRMYRETTPYEAAQLAPTGTRADMTHELFLANTPDLALGQHGNKGVLLEFDAKGLDGELSKAKPAWEFAYDSGNAEFVAKFNEQSAYHDAVRSVTILPRGLLPKNERASATLIRRALKSRGWTESTTETGATRFERPEGPLSNPAETHPWSASEIPSALEQNREPIQETAPNPSRPSLGDTDADILAKWKELSNGPQPPGQVVVGVVPLVGRFEWRGDQLFKSEKGSGRRMATTREATRTEANEVESALMGGRLQIERQPVSGVIGGQGGAGTGAERAYPTRVLHQATGVPLGERLEAPEPPREASPIAEAPRGNVASAVTERGTKVKTRYALVEASDPITSHTDNLSENPRYPQELQPRDRSRGASRDQIDRIARNMNPELLGPAPKASDGAPILGPDGVVESGNGRALAIRQHYRNGAGAYRTWLEQNAEDLGLDPERVRAMKQPMLVRVRESEVPDRAAFTREANEAGQAAMSATEQGMADASALSPELLASFRPSEEGDVLASSNDRFVASFFDKVIGPSERGKYEKDGQITPDGVRRIQNAVLAKAFGSRSLVERVSEATDDNVKILSRALQGVAPRILELRAREHENFAPLDIAPELSEAVEKISDLRRRKIPLDIALRQADAFNERPTPAAERIIRFLGENKTIKKVRGFLDAYADVIDGATDGQTDLFGEKQVPSKLEAVDAAEQVFRKAAEAAERDAPQASLFGEAPPRSGAETRPGGDEGTRKKERPIVGAPDYPGKSLGAAAPDDLDARPSLFDRAKARVFGDPDAPQRLISRRAAARNVYGSHGLNQLQEVSPDSFVQALRVAGSRPLVESMSREARLSIADELGGLEKLPEFDAAVTESGLRGMEHWFDEHADALRDGEPYSDIDKDGDEVMKWAVKENQTRYRRMLEALDETHAFAGRDLADTFAEMMKEKEHNYPGASAWLSEVFDEARDKVGTVIPDGIGSDSEDLHTYSQRPEVQRALKIYRQQFEKPLREAHARNEGDIIEDQYLGPMGVYGPLVATEQEGGPRKPAPTGEFPTFAKPRNPGNKTRTGVARGYETGFEHTKRRVAKAVSLNEKAALMKELSKAGLRRELGEDFKPRRDDPGGFVINGRRVEAAIERGEDGKWFAIPRALRDELKFILKDEEVSENFARKAAQAITTISTFGTQEAAFHSLAQLGRVVSHTPFVADSVMRNIPLVRTFPLIYDMAKMDANSPEFRSDLQYIAKIGAMPERFGEITTDKKYAALTGAEYKPISTGAFIYGPGGVDARARVTMLRVARAMNPNLTEAQAFEFIQQLGTYNHQLENHLARLFKRSSLSPFFTAGHAGLRAGVDSVLSTGEIPLKGKDASNVRLQQQIAGGAVGALLAWQIAHKAYRGKFSWEEDDKPPLFGIEIKPEDKGGLLYRSIYGKDQTGKAYVSLGSLAVMPRRGMSALGIKSLFESKDRSAAGITRQAVRDSANTLIHPITGPPVRVPLAIFGMSPYITHFDESTGAPHFKSTLKTIRKEDLAPGEDKPKLRIGERLKAGALEALPTIEAAGEAVGLGDQDKTLLRTVLDMSGIFGFAKGPYPDRSASRFKRPHAPSAPRKRFK